MSSAVRLNLVVIRVADLERAKRFYELLGLQFIRHRHDKGPEHLSAELAGIVFELYLQTDKSGSTQGIRLGFNVTNLDQVMGFLSLERIVAHPHDSPWGRRAVVTDPDGHKIELVEI